MLLFSWASYSTVKSGRGRFLESVRKASLMLFVVNRIMTVGGKAVQFSVTGKSKLLCFLKQHNLLRLLEEGTWNRSRYRWLYNCSDINNKYRCTDTTLLFCYSYWTKSHLLTINMMWLRLVGYCNQATGYWTTQEVLKKKFYCIRSVSILLA